MDARLYLLSLNNHLVTLWFQRFLWSDESFLELFKLLSRQDRCKINYRIPANYMEPSSVACFGEKSIIAKEDKVKHVCLQIKGKKMHCKYIRLLKQQQTTTPGFERLLCH